MARRDYIEGVANGVIEHLVPLGYNAVSAMVAISCDDTKYGVATLYKNYGGLWKIPPTDDTLSKAVRIKGVDYVVKDDPFSAFATHLDTQFPQLKGVNSPLDFLNVYDKERADALMYLISKNGWTKYDPVPLVRTKLDYRAIVDDVLSGRFGRGLECKQAVVARGYNFKRVERMLKERRQYVK